MGLLRDGRPSHGYELAHEYRQRSGMVLPSGSVYRSLGRLFRSGFVEVTPNVTHTDMRRQPYRITPSGRHVFDKWMRMNVPDGDLGSRLAFLDRLPRAQRLALVDHWRSGLALVAAELEGARTAARQAVEDEEKDASDLLPALIERRIRQVRADIDFLQDLSGVLAKKTRPTDGPSAHREE